MKRLRLSLVLGVLSVSLRAEPAAPAGAPKPDDPVIVLPPMEVATEAEGRLADRHFPKAEELRADFSASMPPLQAQYPGHAFSEGVYKGTATVGVMLDAAGKPIDYLLVRYTKLYFGESLLRAAHRQQFAARQVRGVAVPGSFCFTYEFAPPSQTVYLTGLDAAERRREEIAGGPRLIYEPHREIKTDAGGLQLTHIAVPLLPDGYAAPDGKPVTAIVSFYVDESGRVRLPNVEYAASPTLVPNAIAAISRWTFKPATIKGEPVLVFAKRVVTFRPRPAAAVSSR